MRKTEKCNSCGKGLLLHGSTTFLCPNCNEAIGRCDGCREQSVRYVCTKCGFSGP